MVSQLRKACIKEGGAPRACKPFALFVKKNGALGKGSGSSRADHIDEMKRLGKAWRALSANEKAVYQKESLASFCEQHKALAVKGIPVRRNIFTQKVEPEKSSEKEAASEEATANSQPVQIGSYHVAGTSAKNLLGTGGAYGQVYLCEDPDEKLRAVKVYFGGQRKDHAKAELSFYQRLQSVLGGVNVEHFPSLIEECVSCNSFPYIVLQYGGPSLRHALAQSCQLPFMPIAKQLKKALSLMHQAGIVHLDVKPSNILWSSQEQLLKLCDLGMCETAPHLAGFSPRFVSYVTEPYRPPELFAASRSWTIEEFRSVLTSSVDVWSYGCVMYEVAAQKILMRPTDGRQGGASVVVAKWSRFWQMSGGARGIKQQVLSTVRGARALGSRALEWENSDTAFASAMISRLKILDEHALKVVMLTCSPVPTERQWPNI